MSFLGYDYVPARTSRVQAPLSRMNFPCWIAAARQGREDDVLEQLKYLTPSDVNLKNTTMDISTVLSKLLLISAELGLLRVVERVLKLGVNGDSLTPVRPLHNAARKGNGPIARLLIGADVDVNAEDYGGNTPLHWACDGGHINVVAALVESLARVNCRNHRESTPLHLAAARGYVSVIDILVNAGADVEAEDGNGSTPLHEACKSLCKETVLSLLNHGSLVNAVDSIEETPLHVACNGSCAALIETLCSHGADVNAQSEDGETPLHISVLQENGLGIVELLKFGAHVNARNNSLQTPLHHAKHWIDIESLLEAGAHMHVEDRYGRTPLDTAVFVDFDFLDVFLDYGAYDESVARSFYVEVFETLSSRLYQEHTHFPHSAECILEYFVKILVARLNVYANCKMTMDYFPKDSLIQQNRVHLEGDCMAEIDRMKSRMLYEGSEVSYYDVLRTSNFDESLPLLSTTGKHRLQTEFPIYGRLLVLSWRKVALADGTYRFFQLTPETSVLLPELVRCICQYLTRIDVENLTKLSNMIMIGTQKEKLANILLEAETDSDADVEFEVSQ